MISQMADDKSMVEVLPIGGDSTGQLGTDPMRILEAFKNSGTAKNVFVFCDIGSSVMAAESALELLDDEKTKAKIHLVDAPLVEGSFAAAVAATVSGDVDSILSQVEDAKKQKKFG